jgi:hypothetical protein
MPTYTYTTLHDPLATGAAATGASGINDSGQVVGTYVHLDTVTDAANTDSSMPEARTPRSTILGP